MYGASASAHVSMNWSSYSRATSSSICAITCAITSTSARSAPGVALRRRSGCARATVALAASNESAWSASIAASIARRSATLPSPSRNR